MFEEQIKYESVHILGKMQETAFKCKVHPIH